MIHDERQWWRDAVVYQVYPRSFSDSNGDGIGDIPGIIDRLDYIASLSVDAIWISPFYTSPMKDGGYDVAHYMDIDPMFGTLADADRLIKEAHARGMRVLFDIVPNHTSSEHAWFLEAKESAAGSPAWDRYIIRPGKGPNAEIPPNNWQSVFHGAGWSPMLDTEDKPTGYWYLHLFDSSQPDLNWDNPEVHEQARTVLRFWFDRGVDGFRIDVANSLIKAPGLPDVEHPQVTMVTDHSKTETPYWDQDGVHEIYREWRAIADSYDPPRAFCGEAWVPRFDRLALYLRSDELHTCFNFEYLKTGWDAQALRTCIDNTLAMHRSVDAAPTWVLSNHDVVRHASRLAPGNDAERGLARARALTLFSLALPGSMYLYQGEELGLPEVHDLPSGARQDPTFIRSRGQDVGRDGCRVPIPWSGEEPSYGFGPSAESWLPQPAQWAELTAEQQAHDPASTLAFYQAALDIRRRESALGDGPMDWLDAPPDVLAIRRTNSTNVIAVLNLSEHTQLLSPTWGTQVLLGSGTEIAILAGDGQEACVALGPETAVWLSN
jgi:alpha-glucosidase